MKLRIMTKKGCGTFRRAGRVWSETPETVDADVFSPEQRQSLEQEPLLIVQVLAEPTDEMGGETTAPKKARSK